MRYGAVSAVATVIIVAAAAPALACNGDGGSRAGTPATAPATTPAASQATASVTASQSLPPTSPPSQLPAADLPIIDLHFHPEAGWGDELAALFDDLNVRAAGNGAQASDADALALAERYAHVIPFAGGYSLRQLVLRLGAAAWELESAEVRAYLDQLQAALETGQFRGIGEVHVDSTASYFTGTPPIRFPADAPLMRRLWSLSAAYNLPLNVHMDGSAESVAAMERLLAADRQGTWLWAHAGHYAEPPLLARLLRDHPNLYLELSYRSSISPSRTAVPLDAGGVLLPEWRDLIEAFPGRSVIGTDLAAPSAAEYTRHIGFWRAILAQLTPETAALLAHGNAERLVGRRRGRGRPPATPVGARAAIRR
jgi:hypothetical protein